MLKRLEENRRIWQNCMNALSVLDGRKAMEEQECRRAYRYGGLLHVGLLNGRLERVAEVLRYSNEESWEFRRWESWRLDWHFRENDESLGEEGGEDLDATAAHGAVEMLENPWVEEAELCGY